MVPAVSRRSGSPLDHAPAAEELRRAAELAARIDATALDPTARDLLQALRRVPELLEELSSTSDRLARLERQTDDLFARLVVTETALRSASEARDAAASLLAEVRAAVGGGDGAATARELLETVRRLSRERS